jgi:hypothetical protein
VKSKQFDGVIVPAPEGNLNQATQLPTLELPPGVTTALRDHLDTLLHLTQPQTQDEFLRLGERAADALASFAPDLLALAHDLRRPGGPTAAYITGLPVDAVTEVTEPTPLSDLVTLGLAKLFGEPFQYRQQNGGQLIARLTPKPEYAGRANTGESNLTFNDHTDDRPWAPDYSVELILLVGVVNDVAAPTTFTPIDPIVAQLGREEIAVLSEPRFVSALPKSFGLGEALTPPLPVLWKSATGEVEVGLPTYSIRVADPADTVAKGALNRILELVANPPVRHAVVVGPGTALVFRNNRGLHGRAGFDGKRLVLRCYVRESLANLQAKSGEAGPVFDARKLL